MAVAFSLATCVDVWLRSKGNDQVQLTKTAIERISFVAQGPDDVERLQTRT